MLGFHCTTCGQYHAEFPMEFGAPLPDYVLGIPEAARSTRCTWTEEVCVIDDTTFFIRGCLAIPIQDHPNPFIWGVWVSLSAQNFARARALWTTPGREQEPPYFGWLSTQLPEYPNTLNLKTLVHTRGVRERPAIELEPTDHPLAQEQQHGMTWRQAQHKIEQMLHTDEATR